MFSSILVLRIFFAEISLADLVSDPNMDSNPEPNPEPDPNIDTRSLSQWFGFADPDSDQNIMDPEPDPNKDPDP
jgi:hypothetical protein